MLPVTVTCWAKTERECRQKEEQEQRSSHKPEALLIITRHHLTANARGGRRTMKQEVPT
jgi:hypothetical protein